MSAAAALACPRCGARLPGVATSALLDCAACAAPLAVHVPGESVRESLAPRHRADDALAAAAGFWKRGDVPAGFAQGAPEAPELLFAAVCERRRTLVSRRGGRPVTSDTRDVALAAPIPGLPLEKVDFAAALDSGARAPFEPAALQRRGLVFDPVKAPGQLFATTPGGEVVDERLGLVYVPLWLVRKRFRLGVYEALVDDHTGRVVHAHAPVARTKKLLQAALLVYFLAALLAMPARGWGHLAGALSNLDELGVAMMALIPAGLLFVAAWAWDRLRFRYELSGDSSSVEVVPINRPPKTLLERAAKKTVEVTLWILSKIL